MSDPVSVRLKNTAHIPDLIKLARYQRMPDLGPQVLFFSGGSALTDISRELKNYTHNSIHLVTPFDSGGSSAKLRNAFAMPSIGDLRSRMMALADETILGHPEIFQLFTMRFPKDAPQSDLVTALNAMVKGQDEKISAISNPMRRLIRNHLGYFQKAMPKDFDLKGASIGNLILAGGYLNNHHKLDPIIVLFSKLVDVRGTVRTMVNKNLHVAADLADGTTIVGQHRLTGKENAPLESRIDRFFLNQSADDPDPAVVKLAKSRKRLIEDADLICFSPGSFYSSVVANLLPTGVGSAVAANGCPKVYLPSLGEDPEQFGLDLAGAVRVLIDTLRHDAGGDCPVDRLLDFVLLDTKNGSYHNEVSLSALGELGVQIIDMPLTRDTDNRTYDPKLVTAAILSLC